MIRIGVLLALALLCGCGKSGPATGTVSGKLTIGGAAPQEPVRVHFINSLIGQGASGTTTSDGSYTLDQPIYVDEYTVYFEKLVDASGPISTQAEQLQSIPKDYRTEMNSPLKQQVKEGPNVIDLDIPSA